MAYVSLYRKYRSQTFGDLIGQNHVVRTLQNAISSNRIAQAYLFTGPRGTGKTSTARLLAKALCCENGPTGEPCNVCDICTSITANTCLDVVEMDAASESSVDSVRESIVERVGQRPAYARYRVMIIDEVHDLSAKAFDALLKTIEEPPPHLIFILATTEYNKVPPTIRSRCQKYEFHRATLKDLIGRLAYVADQEGAQADPNALLAIARMADGGYRDALTLLEQALLTYDGKIGTDEVYAQLGLVPEEVVDRLLVAITAQDAATIMNVVGDVTRMGRDPRAILESMMYRLADLTRAAYGVETGIVDSAQEAAMKELSVRLGAPQLLRLRGLVAEAHKTIRDVTLPRLWLESELLRLATTPPATETAPKKNPVPTPTPAPHEPPPPASPPKSEPRPSVPPAETAPPKPAPVSSHEPPELRQAREIWARVVQDLSSVSKLMKAKLGSANVLEFSANRLVVGFGRKLDLDWVTEVPKREAALREKVRQFAGEQWEVAFVPGTNGPTKDAGGDDPVELVLDGERLRAEAEKILRNAGN
ncbi:MAG: DNA polymerase III subunit gamma/tau [Fimbriimonadaceae bacterium]|nr:DNA polymerase III subunit gamma/tau [Fimbriimonadaceae bacterium]